MRSGARWRGSDSSSSTRAIQQQITGKLEHCHSLLARDGWIGIEKPLKAVARTEKLDEDADRDASALEDGRTTQDLGITANDIGNVGHLGHRTEYSIDRRLTVELSYGPAAPTRHAPDILTAESVGRATAGPAAAVTC